MDYLQLHFFSEHIKEAKKKKKEGLNKMQQAALLGGGAAMLGLGGLGYALHKGAKETNQIVKSTRKSIGRGNKAMAAFDKAVKETRKTDRLFGNKVNNKMKSLDFDNDSSGFGD